MLLRNVMLTVPSELGLPVPLLKGLRTVFWVILTIHKITSKLKETWKKNFAKIEKHQRENNNP